ncbi:uncharacterized protein UHOR_14181 [Ustilago hordei]|uniref:Reverse transcriptase domain-containing protein n=1 Tax=Ustilago hordei TaxID=120017 RepID=I2FSZ2_USTHO|nr:uncharacterized protein UHOR_14181 [Ustilago hordei]
MEHDLQLELAENSKPPQGPLYLKGPKEMAKLCKYLDENLAKGFIQPLKSPARSPVLFVPKKDGGLGLNEITVKNRAPLPLIDEQLFLLCKARIYLKLDLRATYNLIHIVDRDKWKTAFGTQLGLYEYLVMPFGLANAPAHFQSFINHIFHNIIGIYVVVYLDDFLIFSDMKEEHITHVIEILSCLKKHRLFTKLSKCEFHTDTIKFLGYIIKPTGIEMDLEKFELPGDAKQAFHKLIQAFMTAGVLKHFDYHLPTWLETDASDFAIAGVLKQEHEGCWHPVAYYPCKMASAEKNYEIHDKELLAVVACLTQWCHMLAGLPNQLVILTDHEALKWAVLLADFDFVLQYHPGNKAGEPDALTQRRDMQPVGEEQEHNLLPSRVFEKVQDVNEPQDTPETAGVASVLIAATPTMEAITSQGLLGLVQTFQPLDQELQEMQAQTPFETRNRLWHKDGCLLIPKPGSQTMWRVVLLLQPLSTPERPWGSISLDFIEGLLMSGDYDSILVIVDQLTKYTIMSWSTFVDSLGAKHSPKQYLQMYCNYEQDDWSSLIHMVAFMYNNTVHASIGISPFFACYGWNPKSHPEIPGKLGVNDPKLAEYFTDNTE